MTRIQRIELKAKAEHFKRIAGFLAERSLERAAEGATGLAAKCAHQSIAFHDQARRLEREAKQPFVWEAR